MHATLDYLYWKYMNLLIYNNMGLTINISLGSFALLPFLLCRELSTFIGCGAVLVTAALYGVMAIGKK